jgi:hypothetical protein
MRCGDDIVELEQRMIRSRRFLREDIDARPCNLAGRERRIQRIFIDNTPAQC